MVFKQNIEIKDTLAQQLLIQLRILEGLKYRILQLHHETINNDNLLALFLS